jgi:hydroxymethylpyrimidine/phosphomethylpyrimidine kinase
VRVALTIAGSDPSGGAGIQADLKTFHQFGVYGEAAVTLITVQNTLGVERVECLPPDLVSAQIRAVIDDIRPQAAKTGALGNAEVVEAVAALAANFDFPLVVDPVLSGTQGARLASENTLRAICELLVPRAYLLTPNLAEASALAGFPVEDANEMRKAAERLVALGANAVLVKGGHLADRAADVLLVGDVWHEVSAARIETVHTHGTGCTYSAAITAGLALGNTLPVAVARAKAFVTEAIRTNPGLGRGAGPLNHHARGTK